MKIGVILPQTTERLGLLEPKETRKGPAPAGFRGSTDLLIP